MYIFHSRTKDKHCYFNIVARVGKCGVTFAISILEPKGLWKDGNSLLVTTICSWEISASSSYWRPRSTRWMCISFAQNEIGHTTNTVGANFCNGGSAAFEVWYASNLLIPGLSILWFGAWLTLVFCPSSDWSTCNPSVFLFLLRWKIT
jgi:hypothetical protein